MAKVRRSKEKPNKPYPSFPLTAHGNGQWCKKIRGKVQFFGVWSAPNTALDKYHRSAADLHAGRAVSVNATCELTVKELGNEHLAYQMERVAVGQIGARWFEDCRRVVRHFAKCIGTTRDAASLTATDFQRYRNVLATKGLTGKQALGVHALAPARSVRATPEATP